MPRYRKKPVEIEAVQYFGPEDEETREIPKWLIEAAQQGMVKEGTGGSLIIHTHEGAMICPVGNWIIRGIAGEIYSCAPEIFQATYEPVE